MTEGKNTFSKADIIRLTVGRDDLSKTEAAYKSNEKNLSEIIDFIEKKYLKEDSQDFEMIKILEEYFTLAQPARNKLEKNKYSYSTLDAVLLVTLLKSDVVGLLNDINRLKYSFDYSARYSSFIESFNINLENFEALIPKMKKILRRKKIQKDETADELEEIKRKEDRAFDYYFLKHTYPLNLIAHYIVSSEYFSAFEEKIHEYFNGSKRTFNRLTKSEKYDFLLHSDSVKKALNDLERYELEKEASEEKYIYDINAEKNKYYKIRIEIKVILKKLNEELKKIETNHKKMSPLFEEVKKMLESSLKKLEKEYDIFIKSKIKDDFKEKQLEESLKELNSIYVSVGNLNKIYSKQFVYRIRKQLKEALENTRDKIRVPVIVSDKMIESGLEEILKNIRLINDYSNNDSIYEIKERLQHAFEKIYSSMNNFNLNFNYFIKEEASKIIRKFEESEDKIEEDDDAYVLIEQQTENLLDLLKEKEEGTKNETKKEENFNSELFRYIKAELNLPDYNFSKDFYDGKTYTQLNKILMKKEEDLRRFIEEIDYIYDLLK